MCNLDCTSELQFDLVAAAVLLTLDLDMHQSIMQDGRILIGGADTKDMDVKAGRAALAVIPQEPFMFTGTLRDNLDPFGVHEDAELVDIVQDVGLGTQMSAIGAQS
jgi:ABC-type multidrug transport system fused ATPase/permease subunit